MKWIWEKIIKWGLSARIIHIKERMCAEVSVSSRQAECSGGERCQSWRTGQSLRTRLVCVKTWSSWPAPPSSATSPSWWGTPGNQSVESELSWQREAGLVVDDKKRINHLSLFQSVQEVVVWEVSGRGSRSSACSQRKHVESVHQAKIIRANQWFQDQKKSQGCKNILFKISP